MLSCYGRLESYLAFMVKVWSMHVRAVLDFWFSCLISGCSLCSFCLRQRQYSASFSAEV